MADRLVPFVRLRCNPCRRAVSRETANEHKGGAGLPKVLERKIGICPHHRTVWAPGEGPGSGRKPPPGSGWSDRRGPV